ncbi:MAG: hypothetical protein AB1942_01325 [Pseudomonadota bacterium]
MRPDSVFRIERFGERWAVVCDGEPLVVTETEADAARLAQDAVTALMPPRPPRPVRPAEPRSFADAGVSGRAFGFPVVDVRDGN